MKTKILVILAIVLLILALDLIFVLPWSLSRLTLLKFTILDLIFTPTILIVFVWGILKAWSQFEKRMDAKLDQFHKNWKSAERGFKGEDLVYAELQKILDPNSYHIFRNLVLKGKKWDIDFVIVGPKGVILLEVKNFQNSKDIYTANHQYIPTSTGGKQENPHDLRKFVGIAAVLLEKYLVENGVDRINVRKVILYVNPESVEISEYGGNQNRVFIIQGVKKLHNYLVSSKDDPHFNSDMSAKLNSILKKLN